MEVTLNQREEEILEIIRQGIAKAGFGVTHIDDRFVLRTYHPSDRKHLVCVVLRVEEIDMGDQMVCWSCGGTYHENHLRDVKIEYRLPGDKQYITRKVKMCGDCECPK
jgi:hypothetical protein